MKVFCLTEFKDEFEKLLKSNSYKDLEKQIIDFFFGKKPDEFFGTGRRLNGTNEIPFIKMRLEGRSGYRFYYLLIIKNDELYLMFLHPKTGPNKADNITKDFKKIIYNAVLIAIKDNNLFEVSVSNSKLQFKKISSKILISEKVNKSEKA